MAKIRIANGRRGKMLADLIAEECPDAKMYIKEIPDVLPHITVEGSCLVLTKNMIRIAYFNEPDMEEWVTKLFINIAMNKEGTVISRTSDKLVIADSNEEKTMLLRMRPDHQSSVAVYSEKLGMSRNEFVQNAIEFYTDYLKTIKNDDANNFEMTEKMYHMKNEGEEK